MAPFLFFSILYDDCLERGKGIFSGGARYLGGSMEIYGFTNPADSLNAIRRLVFHQKRLKMNDLVNILDADFDGFIQERLEMPGVPKYGNDNEEADRMVTGLHEFICNYARGQKEKTGLHFYLIVRVGGFSARFVELSKEVQMEILNRTLY